MSANQSDVRVLARADTPSDQFVASIVAGDPKLRAAPAIMRALSPGEANAWLEVGRRMAQSPVTTST